MRVVKKKTLQDYWETHAQAEKPLKAWYAEAVHAHWITPDAIKQKYRSADFLPGNRVVFNHKGNDFRLVVQIHYSTGIVYIRFIGMHAEYDRIDAEKI